MSVTIYDIAKRVNVSAATVSRALSNRSVSSTSDATRQRVLQAAQEMGYRPNTLARALITGKTHNLALFVRTTQERTGQHFARMLEAVEVRARNMGYRILVCGDVDGVMGEGQVDGLMLLASPDDNALIDLMQNTPHIFVWTASESTSNCVSWSDAEGVYLGTKYLINLGHRKIVGLFGDCHDDDPPIPKVAGYRQAVEEAEMERIECFGELGTDQFDNGYLLIKELLNIRDDFTAVLARNDYMALGAMKALRNAGKIVPDDVSIVGYNDTILAHCADPALTSVRTPIAEAGELAVEQLVRSIEGNESSFSGIILPVSITLRSSCLPPKR